MTLPAGLPDVAGDFGDRAVQLAELAGLVLDPWQRLTLRSMLRVRADGQWAAYESLILVPRQNGKSVVLEAFDLAKLFLSPPGRLIMHTAHLFPTAMESFRHLLGLINNTPELAAEVKRVSMAHGAEGIELHNGSRLRFAARGVNGAGRGFSPDDVVFDEAYRLPPEAESALVYAVSAKPNPQLVYASSTGFPDSTILWSLMERGRKGDDGSLMLAEWSASPDWDLDDDDDLLAAILESNPAVGYRHTVEKIRAEHRKAVSQGQMVEWSRERLGLWAEMANRSVIDLQKWSALADRSDFPAPHVGKVVLAVDSAPDRAWSSIVAAGARADGPPLIEMTTAADGTPDNRPGVDWVLARIGEIGPDVVACVVIDDASAAASLIKPLEDARFKVVTTSGRKYAQACGQFYDAVVETGALVHLDDPLMLEALRAAAQRTYGDAWAWKRKDATADITPLVAATLALWGFTSGVGVKKNAGSGRVIALT